jgi:hypothetical protein
MLEQIKDDRLHRLLKFIIREYSRGRDGTLHTNDKGEAIRKVRNEFTIRDLTNSLLRFWIFVPRTYETEYLCKILERHFMIYESTEPNSSVRTGLWITNSDSLQRCREAYYSRHFKEDNAWLLAIYISTIANALASLALVLLTYFQRPAVADTGLQQLQLELLQQSNERLKQSERELKILKESIQKTDSLARPPKPRK